MNCPYCGKPAVLRDSSVIYGRSYGMVWICPDYPACDSYVGCHKGIGRHNKPLGRMANRELREAKKAAHAAFDPLWKAHGVSRSRAYAWLAERLGVVRERCHIGMMDVAECRRVIAACREVPT